MEIAAVNKGVVYAVKREDRWPKPEQISRESCAPVTGFAAEPDLKNIVLVDTLISREQL
jgi:hypothetical protein